MIESAVYKYLANQTPITDIVGTRIYPHHLPQSENTYPVLTIQLISNNHRHHLTAAAGDTLARVQIDSWATSLADAVNLAEAVRQELHGFMGTMDTTEVSYVALENEQNMATAPTDGSDNWIYRKSQDYMIHYGESVPTF